MEMKAVKYKVDSGYENEGETRPVLDRFHDSGRQSKSTIV